MDGACLAERGRQSPLYRRIKFRCGADATRNGYCSDYIVAASLLTSRAQAEGEILPFAARNRIGVIVYSPMYSGLLSGKMTRARIAKLPPDDWRGRNRNFQEPLISHNLRLVELLREIGVRHEVTAGEVAIAWTLQNPAVTGAIVGVRSKEQVMGIIQAGEFRLSANEVNEIAEAQMSEAQELSLFS